MARYLDASLLVRSYLGDEDGSRVAHALLSEPGVESVGSEVLEVELGAAAAAAERAGRIPSADDLIARFAADSDPDGWVVLVPLGLPGVGALAGVLARQHGLRALDALHLATAKLIAEVGDVSEFATVDGRLAAAARAEGFQVVP
jgi:predicted nucleic acid-binding protein